MKELESLHKELMQLLPMKPEFQKMLDDKFMLDFNYNSNHIEGNTLTYGQTKLLLLFGKTTGDASLRDYQEMKAHNAGLKMVIWEARDKDRILTERFIRDLNRIILVENFEKPSEDGKMMKDLVEWYNKAEKSHELHPIELAALLHYRFIRIHPFEDGNGRVARLLVNYILLKHKFPMIIVPSKEKKEYLDALNKCDIIVGMKPSEGASAKIEEIKPLIDYMKKLSENAIRLSIKAAKGESIDEQDDWKKELMLIKNQKINAPLYSSTLAKQALKDSFIPLIKKIDEELSVYYELFDKVQFVDNSSRGFDIKKLTESQFSVQPKTWCDFRFYKKLIKKGEVFYQFKVAIIFEDHRYIISIISLDEELTSLEFSYATTIDESITNNIISDLGRTFTSFVKNELVGY
jgi:Fic family protein